MFTANFTGGEKAPLIQTSSTIPFAAALEDDEFGAEEEDELGDDDFDDEEFGLDEEDFDSDEDLDEAGFGEEEGFEDDFEFGDDEGSDDDL